MSYLIVAGSKCYREEVNDKGVYPTVTLTMDEYNNVTVTENGSVKKLPSGQYRATEKEAAAMLGIKPTAPAAPTGE